MAVEAELSNQGKGSSPTSRAVGNVGETAVHQGARAHHRLVELVEAGEEDRAARAWRRHLDEVTEFLLADGQSAMVLDLLS